MPELPEMNLIDAMQNPSTLWVVVVVYGVLILGYFLSLWWNWKQAKVKEATFKMVALLEESNRYLKKLAGEK